MSCKHQSSEEYYTFFDINSQNPHSPKPPTPQTRSIIPLLQRHAYNPFILFKWFSFFS